MKIIDFLDDHEWAVFLIGVFIISLCICVFVDLKIAQLYEVQSKIVIHDYGHVFEDINDWKLERIEKFEKGALNDV